MRAPRQEPPTAGDVRDLLLLEKLRKRLDEYGGLRVSFEPGLAALQVVRSRTSSPIYVFVGYGGAYFSSYLAERLHPVDDVEGAARAIAAFVTAA